MTVRPAGRVAVHVPLSADRPERNDHLSDFALHAGTTGRFARRASRVICVVPFDSSPGPLVSNSTFPSAIAPGLAFRHSVPCSNDRPAPARGIW